MFKFWRETTKIVKELSYYLAAEYLINLVSYLEKFGETTKSFVPWVQE
jgi:hypothetical protein